VDLSTIGLRSIFFTAAVIGGAVFLVIQMRVALGLSGAPSTGAELSAPAATARSAASAANPWSAASPASSTGFPMLSAVASGRAQQSRVQPSATLSAAEIAPPEPVAPLSAPAEDSTAEEVKACSEGIQSARKLASALPVDDLSRYFAERYLQQASAEAGNGETDECREFVEQAMDEVKEHRHQLAPGEKLNILRPDELGG
jgi:hypothetical protein